MKFRSPPRTNELTAVVSILQPRLGYEFTASDLVRALETYDPTAAREAATDRLLHPYEAAQRLGISKRLMYYAIKSGEVRTVKLRSRIRVRESEVLRVIEHGTEDVQEAAKETADAEHK